MSLDLNALFPGASTTFASFFEDLGYCVYSDGRRRTGESWYEICDSDEGDLCFQISMSPPPIAELVADLPFLVEGKASIGPTDDWLACDNDAKLRELIRRVTAKDQT